MDLPTVTRSSQNQDILSGVDGKSAWIGLFRDRWAWSDGSPSYLRFWLAGRPRNEHGCATVSSGNGGRWDGELCYVKRPFVCQGGPKSRVALIKVKMDSRAVVLGGAAARASFLQQLELRLTSQGVSDFTLSWRTEDIQRQAETHRNPVPGN
ncbi:hypothetical protein CRUP_006034 [Coryphaenoides rupestris]|nr:hypothetical protein CRUP_006034 [Coryphaenoides rupestris]